jgi:hypothetical protein
MLKEKVILYFLALMLTCTGIGLTVYKINSLHFPFFPNERVPVWTIGATISFEATGKPVSVMLNLPTNNTDLSILDYSESSDGYGFNTFMRENREYAKWTKREASGRQTIYFSMNVLENHETTGPFDHNDFFQPDPSTVILSNEEQQVAERLIKKSYNQSADNLSFAVELIKLVNAKESSAQINQLLQKNTTRLDMARLVYNLLVASNIPARLSMGLEIHTEKRSQYPIYFVEIYQNHQWVILNPMTAEEGLPKGTILWRRGGDSLIDVIGGRNSQITFSAVKSPLSAKQVAIRSSALNEVTDTIMDFSIYTLPAESQKAFKTILLVPIGALVIVMLRILVGIRTSGTFMPILIALAFMQTTLIPGLLMFLAIVSVGLLIRFLLTSLNLLLVARISAVVIVVIFLMAIFSILSVKLGLNSVMTITFFPMIILAWTIERMSILWEEEGGKEVLIQGGGSLLMASIAYLLMSNALMRHLSFNFPELLLVVLALLLLIGQYSGYRLTELHRFSPLLKN